MPTTGLKSKPKLRLSKPRRRHTGGLSPARVALLRVFLAKKTPACSAEHAGAFGGDSGNYFIAFICFQK